VPIKTGLLVLCVAVFVLIGGSLYVALQAVNTEADIAQAEVRRYHSYQLADELRQSSDDLTRMAQLYAVTGETRYREYFDRILAIRDGKAPRPLDYGNIYWDLMVAWGRPPRRDGPAVSLEQLMREAHFTEDELALLQQAKQRSDALVAIETRAMNAVQGRFSDGQGGFARAGRPDMDLARRLLHGQEYHQAKAEIMGPIQEFFTRVESRTAAEVHQLRRRGERLHIVVIAGLGAAVVLVLISFAVVARYPFAAVARHGGPASRDPAVAHRAGTTLGLVIWTVWPLVAAAVVAGVVVLGLSWWLGESTNDKVRDGIRSALEAVHRSTARSVDDWLASIDREAGAWAQSPMVRGLLARSARGAGGAPARELLAPLRQVPGVAGYVVIDTQGRVLAGDDAEPTSRPAEGELGTRLVARLSEVPDHSMIVLPDDNGPRRDILVAAGVPDPRGTVGGALILRLDPRLELSRILQRGRLGASGETYVFGRSGSILNESRFGKAPGEVTELRAGQPLTRMARAALAGRSGMDLDGYRDHRGTLVIGAWTWNERYGIGSATEVGRAEAFGALGDYQRYSRVATGVSLLLIVALSGVFAWNRLAMAGAAAKLEDAYDIIRAHNERMETELTVGRDLQLSMVPRAFPAFPGHDEVSVYATLRPARELGGDFYDFYFVDDSHLFFCVGDVSDKGVPAALFMAVTKTLIKTRSAEEASTAKLASYLNAELAHDNDKCMFVTLFLGRLNVGTGELVYTNAGHEPPCLRHASGALEVLAERHGPLVGAAPGLVYRESRRWLAPGDLLVVYTDGVSEAQDPDGRLFSEERLAEIVRADGAQPSDAVVDRILAAVDTFENGAERADDITVLALRFLPALVETILRGESSEMERLGKLLDRFEQRSRLPAATMAELRIVCDEIVSNVIAHASPEGRRSDIDVRLELAGSRLVVTVSDDGESFNPLAVAPPDTTLPLEHRQPGGLGIHLVRSLTDEAVYRRQDGRNVIMLVKVVPG
jgi:sigma-B regulation protein RsbU (phosphoserine phosphatase)